MSRDLVASLNTWLALSPHWRIGEILIRRLEQGFELRHEKDKGRDDLQEYHQPEDARRLALYDSSGGYRPLKTAPNLPKGWRLVVADAQELKTALDYFYPAMLGVLRDWLANELEPVSLRETLGRQSGMYAVTRKITNTQADALIGAFCQSNTGCLKSILWAIDADTPVQSLPPEKFAVQPPEAAHAIIPLLCQEACNLLVAKAREIVKGPVKQEEL